MSKRKTREQKIQSQLRELKSRLNEQQKVFVPSMEINLPKVNSPVKSSVSIYDYSYVIKDLRKILIVAAILISIELIVSLTSQNESVKLILRSIGAYRQSY